MPCEEGNRYLKWAKAAPIGNMERATGFEPVTTSLED